jgi:hypothetical protein
MKNLNIIQLNINSFIKKRLDLQLIIQKYSPMCISLQETNLKNNIKSIKQKKQGTQNIPKLKKHV